MAATGLLLPILQFFSNNGTPLAGGFLYTYITGTSTPLTTYLNADLAGGHENANPVVLDSAGRCVVYTSPTPALKVVLKDANLVTLWTQDGVSPAKVAT